MAFRIALAGNPCSLSGSLSASGATATVTGTSRTVTVPVGNSGVLVFANVDDSNPTGTLAYSQNAGAWTAITEGLEVTFANSDTLQIRATGLTSPETCTFTLRDKYTATNIEAVSIART